jgi:hydrogenase 3 maturation protease
MTKGECDLERELLEWFRGAGRVVVVGVGNPIRMDDFVGVKIVWDLKGKVDSDRVMLIEAETIPENHMQGIIDYKPTHILIIDAAKMGLRPGETRLIKPEQLTAFPAFTTHMLPLRIFCEYLARSKRIKIALLLIEPKQSDFGEGLTPEVRFSEQYVVSVLYNTLSWRKGL